MFTRGYLGADSTTNGTVVTVNSTGSPLALGNSLAPSDLCPAFVDGNGGTYATTWDSIYLPPITARMNGLLKGNLNFTDTDVSLFPYLCGFESQITGRLSPWCGTFRDDELKSYEYRQDLRYFYGVGPGTSLAQTMMLPFLNNVVELLMEGPGINGTDVSGGEFTLPDLIMAFANDGQIAELTAALGVFDGQAMPATEIPEDWRYVSSHFVSMRGTVALERLNCVVEGSAPSNMSHHVSDHAATSQTYIRILLNDVVYPVSACHDGPGGSCLLSQYADLIKTKYAKTGNWHANCNVTNKASPTKVKGASFLRDLSLPWLAAITP